MGNASARAARQLPKVVPDAVPSISRNHDVAARAAVAVAEPTATQAAPSKPLEDMVGDRQKNASLVNAMNQLHVKTFEVLYMSLSISL